MNRLKNCLIQPKLLWFLNEKKKRERYCFCLQTNPERNKTIKKFSRHVECSQTIFFSNIFRSFKR